MTKKGISRRELAEELNASPSTIADYASRGMPLRNREVALRWLARRAGGGHGGWGGCLRDRPSIGERAAALLGDDRRNVPTAEAPELTPGNSLRKWDEGEDAAYVAWKLCKNNRQILSEVLAGAFPGAPDPEGYIAALRVFAVVVACYLLEGWAEDLLEFAPPLPPITWEHFGTEAADAQELGEEFLASWQQDLENTAESSAEGEHDENVSESQP